VTTGTTTFLAVEVANSKALSTLEIVN
jgi:hypothetical protein